MFFCVCVRIKMLTCRLTSDDRMMRFHTPRDARQSTSRRRRGGRAGGRAPEQRASAARTGARVFDGLAPRQHRKLIRVPATSSAAGGVCGHNETRGEEAGRLGVVGGGRPAKRSLSVGPVGGRRSSSGSSCSSAGWRR